MSTESLFLTISAIDNASKSIQAIADQIENLEKTGRNLKDLGGNITDLGKGLTAGVTLPIVGALGLASKAAIDFETAMAEVSKASGASGDELNAMGDQVLQLSRTIPLAATEIAGITAAGARLGVSGADNLERFTSMVAGMSVAFDMSSASAADAAAEIANVFNMRTADGALNFDEIEQYGNVVNTLADNMATTEGKVITATQAMSGIASSMGITADQTAALGAGFTALGIAPGVAANAFKVAMQRMGSATPQVAAGMEKLGISVEDFQAQVQAGEGAAAFADVLDKINSSSLGPIEKAEALSDVFGNNYNDTIAQAAAGSETFADALDLMDQSLSGAGASMSESFEAMNQTTAAQMQLMRNSVTEIGIRLGSALLPAINSVLSAVTPLAQGFAEFAQANPGIVKIALGFAAILAAIGPVLIIVGQLVTAVGALASVWATVQAAVMAFSGALAAVGAIGLGPILAVIAAIAAAAYLIIANWQQVKLLFQQIGMVFMQAFAPVLPTIQALWANIQLMVSSLMQLGMAVMQAVMQLFGFNMSAVQTSSLMSFLRTALIAVVMSIFQFVAGIVQGAAQLMAFGAAAIAAAAQLVSGFVSGTAQVIAAVQSMASGVLATIQGLAGQALAAGRQIVASIAQGIMSGIGQVTSAMSAIGNAIKSALPGSPVKEGALTVLNNTASNPGAKISEMIAAGITAGAPAVNSAMSMLGGQALRWSIAADAPVVNSAMPMLGVQTTAIPQVSPLSVTAGGGSISPQITINISGLDNQEEAEAIADTLEERVRRVLNDLQRNDARVAY